MGPVVRSCRCSRAAFVVFFLLALVWGAASPCGPAGAPAAHAAERALSDRHFENTLADPAARAAAIRDFRDLHTSWVRIDVLWSALEPSQGAYDAVQVGVLDQSVDELRAAGIKVMLTVSSLPSWAQDRSYGGFAGTAPPIRGDALDDLARLSEYLAAHFSGRVRALECWNEPNLWPFLYPQRTDDDPSFAARTYLAMLKAFYAGVQRGDPDVLVVAGATAPLGTNDRNRTSPQRFARYLADHGAAAYFDVYSHHPYTTGGSMHPEPEAAPGDTSLSVTLQNLPTLLRLFPGKPFYLTEYGYNTRYCVGFGLTVTHVEQAAYLRRAYAYAQRFKQVKLLCWFLAKDAAPTDGTDAKYGVYTGLRRAGGDRKLAWFAFAGGNRITIDAPAHSHPGRLIRIRGELTNSSVGTVAGRRLVLQSRRLGSGAWRTLGNATTTSRGLYHFDVIPGGGRAYRVGWRGVKISPSRVVPMLR